MGAWETLGLEPTSDLRAIKRAYSVLLKKSRPDDDAQAYQALREAYDAAQQYARFLSQLELPSEAFTDVSSEATTDTPADTLIVPSVETSAASTLPLHTAAVESPAPQQHDRTVEPIHEPMDDDSAYADYQKSQPVVQVVTAAELVQSAALLLQQEGAATLSEEWPRIQAKLEDLPITESPNASRMFAQEVVHDSAWPVDVLIALTRHYQWGLDFKVSQQLGPSLAHTLHERLEQAHVYEALSARHSDSWALPLAKLWDQKRRFWVRLLALCMDPSERQRSLNQRAISLQALGVPRQSALATLVVIYRSELYQPALLFGLFAALAFALHTLSEPPVAFTLAIFSGSAALLFMGLQEFMYANSPTLIAWGQRMRARLELTNTVLDLLVLVPLGVALLSMLGTSDILQFPSLKILLSAACFLIWVLVPTDEHPWRDMVLPMFVILYLCLLGLFPDLTDATLLSLAFGWVMAAHVVLRRYAKEFEATCQSFIQLRFLKARPWYVLGFQWILPLWALLVCVCIPVLVFRFQARCKGLYARLALLGGVILDSAATPFTGFRWLPVWVLAAVWGVQISLLALQRFSVFGLRKLQAESQDKPRS